MEVSLTNAQYSALMDIYGPPENIHFMIMTSRSKDGRVILEGDEEDFEDLLNIISEDIAEDLSPKKNIRNLLAVCKKVDPTSLDWIGM